MPYLTVIQRKRIARVYHGLGYPLLPETVAQHVANQLLGIELDLPCPAPHGLGSWAFWNATSRISSCYDDGYKKMMRDLFKQRAQSPRESIELFTDRHTAEMIQQSMGDYFLETLGKQAV